MTRLHLIRHPPVNIPAGICYGASDVPARTWPTAHIDALRACLPSTALIVSSPLSRCRDLASALAMHSQTLHLDPRLQEIDFGTWELQRSDDIDRALIDAWATSVWAFVPPGGESAEAMSDRVLTALQEYLAQAHDELVIVAHAGPLRVIIGHLLGLPRMQWLELPCDPGSLTQLRVHRGYAVVEVRNQSTFFAT